MTTAENIMTEYLTRVCTFLKQELPTKYWTFISVENNKIIITLNQFTKALNEIYIELQELITEKIFRVRERQYDLHFVIWTPTQTRDFSVLKLSSKEQEI
ncbi:hypothetical protein [Mucilaginibacter corticis]|nr:hypothetical protein [Mucilaginibacter corticis]